jgi:hypothetical protein
MAKQKQQAKEESKAAAGTVVKKVPRAEQVRQEILEANKTIEVSYVDLSKLLAEAYHKEFYLEWGFTDFKDYTENELGTGYRKAMYLVDVADCMKKNNISTAKALKLGWTKLKDLAKVLTEENSKEWMDKAEKMTTRDLGEAVKVSRKEDGGGRENVPHITTMTFRMGEAEASVITEAIEEAKKLLEGGDSAQASVLSLEMICQDWMESKGVAPTRTKLSDHVRYLERVFGVKLAITKAAKKAKDEEEEDEAPATKKTPTKKGKEAPAPAKKGKKAPVEEEEDEAPAPKKGKAKKEEPAPVKGKGKGKKEEPAPPPKKGKKKPEPEEEEDDQDLNDLLGIDDEED